MKSKKTKQNRGSISFVNFLSDPVIATALLVFAFIALMFALHEFTSARGF